MEKSRWSFSLVFFATSLLPDNETLSLLAFVKSGFCDYSDFQMYHENACALYTVDVSFWLRKFNMLLFARYTKSMQYHKKFLIESE